MTIAAPVGPSIPRTDVAPPKPPTTVGTTFAERMARPVASEAPPRAMLDAVHSLERGQRFVDRVIRQALAGRSFSQDELLAIQAGVYRYTQELELFSRMVEKAVAGVRETLKTSP